MRKGYLLGGVLVGLVIASVIADRVAHWPSLVTQTPAESMADPAEPDAYLCSLAFREENGRAWQYGVVTYGRKVRLQPGVGSFRVSVDDSTVEVVPADDVLWAVGPDLQLRRLGVSFREVSDGIEAGEFVRGALWTERLKPMLTEYRWPEK
jgi:hypothetical protein